MTTVNRATNGTGTQMLSLEAQRAAAARLRAQRILEKYNFTSNDAEELINLLKEIR